MQKVVIDRVEQISKYSIGILKGKFLLHDNFDYVFNLEKGCELMVAGNSRTNISIKSNFTVNLYCEDSSFVNIETYNQASPEINVLKNAQVSINTYNKSDPNCCAFGSSRITLKSYDNSTPFLECNDISIPYIIVNDQSKPRFFDWPIDWQVVASDVYVGQELICFTSLEEAVESATNFYKTWLNTKSRYLTSLRVRGSIIKICPNTVDFRWKNGTVHLELPGDENPKAWYSTDAHHLEPLTEKNRSICRRIYL